MSVVLIPPRASPVTPAVVRAGRRSARRPLAGSAFNTAAYRSNRVRTTGAHATSARPAPAPRRARRSLPATLRLRLGALRRGQRAAIARVPANDARVVLIDVPPAAVTRERLRDEPLGLRAITGGTMMSVTYAVEKATLLDSRFPVMSPRPGHIVGDVQMDLPRPQDVSSPEANAPRRESPALLPSHHARTETWQTS